MVDIRQSNLSTSPKNVCPFTCITCRVAFRDLEVQRQHYKSDWHRYNLKRKVSELPPVNVEDFQKKVIANRNKLDEDDHSQQSVCKTCRKTFSTKNQFDNHMTSKKHREKAMKALHHPVLVDDVDQPMLTVSSEASTSEQSRNTKNTPEEDNMELDSDVESVDSDEWLEDTENPVANNDCLFCSHHSKSWVRNLKHMMVAHTFSIPDPEYCFDMKGLLVYLGEKIYAGYMCLWCNEKGRSFRSAEAARSHMIDKGHCKMLHEGEALAEYSDFYDYSASYPDAEMADPEEEVEVPNELEESEYQLVLPSGNVIGHRSLLRYYKQRLNPNRTLTLTKNDKYDEVISMYHSLGCVATQTEAAKRKAVDLNYMQKMHQKYNMQLGVKTNKLQYVRKNKYMY